jgi:hypothetical protein
LLSPVLAVSWRIPTFRYSGILRGQGLTVQPIDVVWVQLIPVHTRQELHDLLIAGDGAPAALQLTLVDRGARRCGIAGLEKYWWWSGENGEGGVDDGCEREEQAADRRGEEEGGKERGDGTHLEQSYKISDGNKNGRSCDKQEKRTTRGSIAQSSHRCVRGSSHFW